MTGRRASLPPAGYEVPSSIDETGLRVTVQSEDGLESRTYDLSTWPGTMQLRREIVQAVAALNGPTGTWRSVDGFYSYLARIRAFAVWSERNAVDSFADVTPGKWAAWVMACNARGSGSRGHYLLLVRAIAAQLPSLPEETRAIMKRRVGKPTAPDQPTYTEQEFRSIQRAALTVVYRAHQRITANYALLQRRRDADLSANELAKVEALHDLFRTGAPTTLKRWRALDGVSPSYVRSAPTARRALFLDAPEALASAVLLMCHGGQNGSTLNRQNRASTTASVGDDRPIYTVENDKPRRGGARRFVTNEADQGGDSPGRAWGYVQASTEPMRAHMAALGEPTDRLLVWAGIGGRGYGRLGIPTQSARVTVPWWPEGVSSISLRMLHRTYQTRINPAPTHNSRATHERTYLGLDAQARAEHQDRAAQGLEDALRVARDQVLLPLIEAEVDPQRDTAYAACTDVHHHPVTGGTCADSFLLCLACPNATATHRHLPRMVLLREALEELRSALEPTDWQRSWQGHYLRLLAFLDTNTSEAEQREAHVTAVDLDRQLIQSLIRGELST